MWKFRPIGRYYELLVDGDSIYLCRKQDTIMQAVIEDLCDRHNKAMVKYENLDVDIASCDEAYLNGLEDGREEASQERYDKGYEDGYKAREQGYNAGYDTGYADGYRRAYLDCLGTDHIE